MKSKNKLEGASNFRAWKTRIDLILAKNKVLDIMKGKIIEPHKPRGVKANTTIKSIGLLRSIESTTTTSLKFLRTKY
jgi:hypothetical protein